MNKIIHYVIALLTIGSCVMSQTTLPTEKHKKTLVFHR